MKNVGSFYIKNCILQNFTLNRIEKHFHTTTSYSYINNFSYNNLNKIKILHSIKLQYNYIKVYYKTNALYSHYMQKPTFGDLMIYIY